MVERDNSNNSCFLCGKTARRSNILKGNARSFLKIPQNLRLEKECTEPLQVYSQRDLQQRIEKSIKKQRSTERKMLEIKKKYGYPPKESKFFSHHMLLIIEIMEGKNFKHSNGVFRKSSPIVEIRVPEKKNGKRRTKELRTYKGKESNINPKWYELFKIRYPKSPESGYDEFSVSAYNSYRVGGRSILGHEQGVWGVWVTHTHTHYI